MEDDSNNTFIIRPDYAHKYGLNLLFSLVTADASSVLCRFRPAAAQELIHNVLSEYFVGKEYDSEACLQWCQEVSDLVKDKLKGTSLLDPMLIPSCISHARVL